MAGEHPRTGAAGRPFAPERGEIAGPLREVPDVAGDRVGAEAARARLTTPVQRGDLPALPAPVFQRLEIFLVGVATAGKEQQPAAGMVYRLPPVDPADCVAIRGEPAAFAGIGGNGATVESRRFRRFRVANFSLLPVVTL